MVFETLSFRLRPARLSIVSRLLLLVAMTLFVRMAAAEPSAQEREQARGLMDLGDEKAAAGDYEAALKAYQGADAIMGVPTTGLEVGRTLEKLGKLVEARDAFIKVTRFPEKKGEPAVFTTSRATAARMATEIGPRIPSLTLKLVGPKDPKSAEVSLDGNALPADLVGLPVKVNPGTRHVKATVPGFLPVEQDITLAEGEKKQLELAFTPDPSASASTPDANAQGAVPLADRGAEEPRAPSRTLMWIGFGVGAAGIAAGSVTGLMSLSKASSAKDQCDGNRCPPEAQDDIDSATTLGNVSNIAFAVGVVGVGVGVWQLFATKSPSSEHVASEAKKFRAEPFVGFGRVGVTGRF